MNECCLLRFNTGIDLGYDDVDIPGAELAKGSLDKARDTCEELRPRKN